MDVPPAMTWTELLALAEDRQGWRKRVHNLRHGPKIEIMMNDSLPGCKALPRCSDNQLPPVKKSLVSPRAKKYIIRDAHEAFFRPHEKGKRKRSLRQPATKKRKKSVPLTNKQRQAWAREHFELHHGKKDNEIPWAAAAPLPSDLDTTTGSWAATAPFPSDIDMTTANTPPPTPTTPLTPAPQWPQQILGHHNLTNHSPNTTIPITPTEQSDLHQYWDDLSQDHDNLRNISMFNL